jgi:hypothetical protein
MIAGAAAPAALFLFTLVEARARRREAPASIGAASPLA